MTAAVSNLAGLLQKRAKNRPDSPAYIFLSGDELRQSSITNAELDAQARVVAGFLHGLKAQGERALLLYPPGLEFITAFFGCLYAGVIAVPAYPPRLNRNALRILTIAQDSQASLALTTNSILSRHHLLTKQAPELGKLRWCATDKLPPDTSRVLEELRPEAESVAYLQYTSGSTASPKGVMVTHANVFENSSYLAKAFHHSDQDVSLSWLPHFHDLGLVHGILQPLYSGFPGCLMAPMSFLQRPLNWLQAISKFRVTHSDGPNFAYELCVSKITEDEKRVLDLTCWKMALNGAEPVFPETIERFTAAFRACGFSRTSFYPAYGLAEATLVVSGGKQGPELAYCCVLQEALEHARIVFAEKGSPGSRTLVASGTFGRPMEVEIVEPESGSKCPPDMVGEIWVAGPSVTRGYWERSEENAQIFRAKMAGDANRKFLRTGDLGFIHRGNLFITGRLKELIIIRGRNYYPQDIERTARESCAEMRLGTGAAFSISTGTEERLLLVQELSRRQALDEKKIFASIREAVAEEYEIQIYQIVLVAAGSIPKTSSGKIQRGVCRAQLLEGRLEVIVRWIEKGQPEQARELPFVSSGRIENIQFWLRSQIASRIGVAPDEIDIQRPLSHLGLDSLHAVELAHDIQRSLGITWDPTAFLEDTTIARLAIKATQESEAGKKYHVRVIARETEYPLSYGQQGLWFLHQLSPQSTAYNVVQAMRIRSSLDAQALQRSFQALVQRHASLRTTFPKMEGQPLQRVHEDCKVAFHSENARGWSDAELSDRLSAAAGMPFDLERGPLFQVHLFHRAATEYVLAIIAHHIIVDLWSLAQMMTELGTLYRAETSEGPADLPALAADYCEFVRWQHATLADERGRALWTYWSKQLSGELPVLELPADHRRPAVQTYCGSSCCLRMSAELTSNLKNLSQECGVTLYMTVLAAFQVLLHRYTGEEDIAIGSATAGRTRAEFASTVGYFVNPVVMRSTVLPQLNFQTFLQQHVRKTVLEAIEHQDYPFSLLTERLQPVRDSSRSPLFQIMFTMQKAHLLHQEGMALFALGESGGHMNLGGLEVESLALDQRIAQFDLSVNVAEVGGRLAATFEYNTDLFQAATIYRIVEQFETLLEGATDSPHKEIYRLFLLTRQQVRELVQAGQGETISDIQLPVHELFEQQVVRTPDAMAVLFEGQQLTYGEVNRRAEQLAHRLLNSGVLPGTAVGVCLQRSSEAVISLLAVLKAGAVYLPLDPDYPRQRLDFLVNDAQVKVLITKEGLFNSISQSNLKMIYVEEDRQAVFPTHPKHAGVDAADPAYIIYTSGSTGDPKGVLVNHGALSNQMQCLAGDFPLNEGDRVLHKYSLSFDASLDEIFHPLIFGAALVIARAGGQHDTDYLIELMRKHRVTSMDAVPALLKVLIEDDRITDCKGLRRMISGGEALGPELQERIYDRLGPIELVNMYGPTETAITATFHRCSSGSNELRIPIGVPIANTQICILDSNLQPVPMAVTGEIYIGGRGMAYGYVNQPQLTAQKFLPHPFTSEPGARLYKTGDLGRYRLDGQVEYLGRTDSQVKIRGFRIELGEIEAELKRHSSVLQAVAVVKTRSQTTKYVAAYVQLVKGETLSPSQLRAYLGKKLPGYMLPAAIVPVDRFSLLSSGKVDTKVLPDPEGLPLETELTPPRQPVEAELVRIWQEMLGRQDIGVHNNFFELGGDSILSIRVVASARKAGLEISQQQIFQFQTIAALAKAARQMSPVSQAASGQRGRVRLTPIQRWFFDQDLRNPSHYCQSVMLTVRHSLDLKLAEAALEHLVRRHDALRLRFHRTEQGWQQAKYPAYDKNILLYVPLQHLSPEEQFAQIDVTSAEIRASLNISSGPILRAAYFDLGAANPHRLLIAIHHLAIDGVSWRILLDDFPQAYEQLTCNGEIVLGPNPLSFQRWSELLQAHAQGEAVNKELDWWTARLSGPVGRVPMDRDEGNSSALSETILICLSPEETRQLLQESPRAYRTEINDLLLAALAQTLAEWNQDSRILIDLEGHGREEIMEGADVSGTVGWFTTLYPVLLDLSQSSGPGEILKSVKQQLRAIPRKGIGYGLLRYLAADPMISARLKQLPSPDVSFNYLGQFGEMFSAKSRFTLAGLMGPIKSALGRRSHVLEIDGYIKDGTLQFQWSYSHELHDRNTIERVAGNFKDKLRTLIRHCITREAGEYVSSDFPLIELTKVQIDRIIGIHGAVENIYPLSPMQQGMLFHSLYEPDKRTYLTQLVCELCGDLDKGIFQTAWQQVVNHYSALRASFEWEIVSEEPVQVVRRSLELKWDCQDWSHNSLRQHEKFLDHYLRRDREQEMDLEHGPLMRFGLMKSGPAKHFFVWSSHHLLMDGWSLPIVLKHVFAAYRNLCDSRQPRTKHETPYCGYIAWVKRQDLRRAENFWRPLLKGFTTPATLESLRCSNANSATLEGFCEEAVYLSEPETARLVDFARRHHLTLSTVAYGIWGVLLSRLEEKKDVVFGAVVSGRQMAGADDIVGVLINTLPVRTRIEPADVLEDYLRQLQDQQAEAAQFEYASLSSIQSWSEVPRGAPLFNSIVVFENYPSGSWTHISENLRVTNVRSYERSNYLLTLWIMPGQRMSLKIGHDPHLLDHLKIDRLLNDYRTLMARVGAAPKLTVAEILQAIPLWDRANRNEVPAFFPGTPSPAIETANTPRTGTAMEEEQPA